jgi:hypothetical protein
METLAIGKFSFSKVSAEPAESFPDRVLALHWPCTGPAQPRTVHRIKGTGLGRCRERSTRQTRETVFSVRALPNQTRCTLGYAGCSRGDALVWAVRTDTHETMPEAWQSPCCSPHCATYGGGRRLAITDWECGRKRCLSSPRQHLWKAPCLAPISRCIR